MITATRNRHGFLLGASWFHHPSFPNRKTHLYAGWFVVTIITGCGDPA